MDCEAAPPWLQETKADWVPLALAMVLRSEAASRREVPKKISYQQESGHMSAYSRRNGVALSRRQHPAKNGER